MYLPEYNKATIKETDLLGGGSRSSMQGTTSGSISSSIQMGAPAKINRTTVIYEGEKRTSSRSRRQAIVRATWVNRLLFQMGRSLETDGGLLMAVQLYSIMSLAMTYNCRSSSLFFVIICNSYSDRKKKTETQLCKMQCRLRSKVHGHQRFSYTRTWFLILFKGSLVLTI